MSKNIKNKASAATVREPLFHVVKRAPMPVWQAMLIRVIAIVAAFLLCTLLSSLLIGKTPVQFVSTFFKGTIGSSRRIWNLAKDAAKLLKIAQRSSASLGNFSKSLEGEKITAKKRKLKQSDFGKGSDKSKNLRVLERLTKKKK